MSTVDSWIDPELIADLVDRLSQPPGKACRAPVDSRVEEPAAAVPEAKIRSSPESGKSDPSPQPASEVGGRKLRSAVEVVTRVDPAPLARPESEPSGVVLSPEGVESLAGIGAAPPASPEPKSLKDSMTGAGIALPAGRREKPPVPLTRRQKVRARLAELRAQASKIEKGKSAPAASPFTSAAAAEVEVDTPDKPEKPAVMTARTEREVALEMSLKFFAESVAKRFGCVRVLVANSEGQSLLPMSEGDVAMLAAAQTLSKSWVGCQKSLRLVEPGVLSTMLGRGYRMIVIPCEMEEKITSLTLVTRNVLGDGEAKTLQDELRKVLEKR